MGELRAGYKYSRVVGETQPNSSPPRQTVTKGIGCQLGLGRLGLDAGKALAARYCCPGTETPRAGAPSILGGFRTWLD